MAEIKLDKGRVIIIKTLVSKLKVEQQDVMVIGFSGGRTTHVSELSGAEANAMIAHLKSLDPNIAKEERMRRKIIGLAYSYHGLGDNATAEEKRAVVANVRKWVIKYGTAEGDSHKDLDDYTLAELPLLVTQFKKVYKSTLKRL